MYCLPAQSWKMCRVYLGDFRVITGIRLLGEGLYGFTINADIPLVVSGPCCVRETREPWAHIGLNWNSRLRYRFRVVAAGVAALLLSCFPSPSSCCSFEILRMIIQFHSLSIVSTFVAGIAK